VNKYGILFLYKLNETKAGKVEKVLQSKKRSMVLALFYVVAIRARVKLGIKSVHFQVAKIKQFYKAENTFTFGTLNLQVVEKESIIYN
jgi:hypothetical protein